MINLMYPYLSAKCIDSTTKWREQHRRSIDNLCGVLLNTIHNAGAHFVDCVESSLASIEEITWIVLFFLDYDLIDHVWIYRS